MTRRSGMSLVEVMISLAISVTLLVAIAAAFSASSSAIQANDEFNRASQASRIAMNQFLAEVRKCKSWNLMSSTKVELTTATDDKRQYEYDAAGKQMTLCFPLVDATKKYPLVRNVGNASFAADADSVTLNITIEIGKHKITLSGSGTPRRTIVFD